MKEITKIKKHEYRKSFIAGVLLDIYEENKEEIAELSGFLNIVVD